VAKLALLPNITATANGRASTPIVAAISNAIGVRRTATALLLIGSVSTVATRYVTESVATGPQCPTAPVTPVAMRCRTCRFHRLPERQHAEDDEKQVPLNRFVNLLDIDSPRKDNQDGGDQAEDGDEKALNAASSMTDDRSGCTGRLTESNVSWPQGAEA